MPRALTVQRTLVTPQERKKFAEKLKRNREYYAAANCRYWMAMYRSLSFAHIMDPVSPLMIATASVMAVRREVLLLPFEAGRRFITQAIQICFPTWRC